VGYEYDVFISYSRHPPVSEWVGNHFHSLVKQWLGEADLGFAPTVFIDTEIHTGSEWPMALRNALMRSRLLIPVWSPSYFRSAWCMAELRTMQARERMCALRSAQNPHGLIFPVRFNNGVPADLVGIQHRDLSPYNYNQQSFADTARFLDLVSEIQDLAAELVRHLPLVPEWNEEWPVELPDVNPSFNVPQPRI
jgi:hypothetical protein